MNFKPQISIKISTGFLVLIFTLLSQMISVSGRSQSYGEIRKFYKNFISDNDEISIPFLDNTFFTENDTEIIQIILVRHGTPVFNKKGWHTFYDALGLLEAYDTVKVFPLQYDPVDVESGKTGRIYSSPLPRARSTALQLTGKEYEIIYDSLFIEFRNEIVPVPWIRMPFKCWSVLSRITWMAGLHSDKVPSLHHEKYRAKKGAEKLNELAAEEKNVVLVAHGFLNRYLIRYLKRMGWDHCYDGGFDYANVQVLSKIINKNQ